MQNDVLSSKWKQLRLELNFHWNQLSAEDLNQVDGKRDRLIFLLQSRYGYARGRAEREVDLFVSEFEDRLRRAA